MASRKTAAKEKLVTEEIPEIEGKTRKSRIDATPETKTKVAVAAIIGEKSISEIATEFGVSTQNVTSWQNTALQAIVERFRNPPRRGRAKSATSSKESNRTDSVLKALDTLLNEQNLDHGNLADTDDSEN